MSLGWRSALWAPKPSVEESSNLLVKKCFHGKLALTFHITGTYHGLNFLRCAMLERIGRGWLSWTWVSFTVIRQQGGPPVHFVCVSADVIEVLREFLHAYFWITASKHRALLVAAAVAATLMLPPLTFNLGNHNNSKGWRSMVWGAQQTNPREEEEWQARAKGQTGMVREISRAETKISVI